MRKLLIIFECCVLNINYYGTQKFIYLPLDNTVALPRGEREVCLASPSKGEGNILRIPNRPPPLMEDAERIGVNKS